jgi:hypothetical protein
VSKISLTPFLYILHWFLKVYLPGLTIKCWNIWYISSSTTPSMLTLNPRHPLTPIPNLLLLMFKVLRLLLLPPKKILRLNLFNPPLSKKISLKKERVRIRRIEIIICNPIKPRPSLLMIRISVNLDILALSVVMITT